MTCGLIACTPGSAPGPSLGNEYGKPSSFYAHRPKTLLVNRCSRTRLQELYNERHYICPQSTNSVNPTGCHFNGTSSSSLLLLISRLCSLKPYLTSLIFLFHTVLSVFLGNLPPQSSVPRSSLIFDSRSFHAAAPTIWNSLPGPICSSNRFNSFRHHLKTPFPRCFCFNSGKLQHLRLTYVTNGAL